jgi:lysophospholipase L1-like esterase
MSGSDQPIALPKIVLFGDSLTQYSFYGEDDEGLGQVMQKRFNGRFEIINEGKSPTSLRPD